MPIAGAPVALAGVAAVALAFGNTHAAAAPALSDAAVRDAAATAATPHFKVSSHAVSITRESATGLPVVRLDATRVAAIPTKGKHHSALPAKYVVKSGDTLASIAKHLYASADYWPALYSANHGKIKDADEISVGQVLTVPAKPAKVPSAPAVAAPAAAPTAAVSYASTSTAASATASPAPATQPASTYTGSTSSFQACVIAAESGGNAQVMNSSGHYGLYQFSASTWAEYGGSPAEFGDATVAEQNQVFDNAIAAGGESNWSAYDGC